MKAIKVLGSGCRNCQITYDLVAQTAKSLGIEIQLEKVEEIGAIMSYGVMSTPGVVVDGTVVHAGGIPDKGSVEQWLKD